MDWNAACNTKRDMRSELTFALRALRRSPMFTAVAVICLGLGIGANTAIYSLLDQVMFRPLAVGDPGTLVVLDAPGANFGRFFGPRAFSYPMYREIRDENQVFAGVAGRFPARLNLQMEGAAETVEGEIVSGNYFTVLGVGAAKGRTLLPQDDLQKGAHPLVVISFDLWMRRFGGDPGIVGRTLRINGRGMTVVGVAEAGFHGVEKGRRAEVYAPVMMKTTLTPTWDGLEERRTMWLNLLARLKPGQTRESAQAGMEPLFKSILEREAAEMPGGVPQRFLERFRQRRLEVLEGGRGVEGQVEGTAGRPLQILMAMVGVVLLIACANVANLLMARASARQKEIAIRMSLGARRGQIVRQLLVESLVLAGVGAAGGLLVASWTGEALRGLLPEQMVRGGVAPGLDGRVLGFTFLVTVATAVLFGLMPALQATRPDLTVALKEQVSGARRLWGGLGARRMLVAAQVALSLLLLFGAGLFLRSLRNLQAIDPGFRAENLVSFQVDAALAGYAPERTAQIYDRMAASLAALPGVTMVSSSDYQLLSGEASFVTVRVQGYEAKPGEDMNPLVAEVGPGYFEALRIPVLLGREFSEGDRIGAPRVAIVNEAFAKYYFRGESPVGRRFGIGDRNDEFEIVGVVKGGKYADLRQEGVRHVYLPWRQGERPGQLTFYVRTGFVGPEAMEQIRNAAASAAPGLAVTRMRGVEQEVDASLVNERLVALLCTIFGALATLLAAIGLYGVTSYAVARRTREIGIRLALGAGRGAVLGLVLREAAWMVVGGLGLGIPLALGVSRLISAQLYGLNPHDPIALGAAAALMAVVSVAAGLIPARRAAGMDPLGALRYE